MNKIGIIYNRPWGNYRTIEQNDNYQLKKICVHPNKRLSLQLHYHRDEHWTIIKGFPLVQVGDEIKEMKVNDYVFIPKETKHRITNNTNEQIEFIEIQIGDYLGEDDIVRLEDDFGRN